MTSQKPDREGGRIRKDEGVRMRDEVKAMCLASSLILTPSKDALPHGRASASEHARRRTLETKTRVAAFSLTAAEDDLAVARVQRQDLAAAPHAPAAHAVVVRALGHGDAVVED